MALVEIAENCRVRVAAMPDTIVRSLILRPWMDPATPESLPGLYIERGEVVTVTYRGKPIAKPVPIERPEDESHEHAPASAFGMWEDRTDLDDLDAWVRDMRRVPFLCWLMPKRTGAPPDSNRVTLSRPRPMTPRAFHSEFSVCGRRVTAFSGPGKWPLPDGSTERLCLIVVRNFGGSPDRSDVSPLGLFIPNTR